MYLLGILRCPLSTRSIVGYKVRGDIRAIDIQWDGYPESMLQNIYHLINGFSLSSFIDVIEMGINSGGWLASLSQEEGWYEAAAARSCSSNGRYNGSLDTPQVSPVVGPWEPLRPLHSCQKSENIPGGYFSRSSIIKAVGPRQGTEHAYIIDGETGKLAEYYARKGTWGLSEIKPVLIHPQYPGSRRAMDSYCYYKELLPKSMLAKLKESERL